VSFRSSAFTNSLTSYSQRLSLSSRAWRRHRGAISAGKSFALGITAFPTSTGIISPSSDSAAAISRRTKSSGLSSQAWKEYQHIGRRDWIKDYQEYPEAEEEQLRRAIISCWPETIAGKLSRQCQIIPIPTLVQECKSCTTQHWPLLHGRRPMVNRPTTG
jgi:hypothetical protein